MQHFHAENDENLMECCTQAPLEAGTQILGGICKVPNESAMTWLVIPVPAI
jgi:hypothetical protein